jgi:hypothetical protein
MFVLPPNSIILPDVALRVSAVGCVMVSVTGFDEPTESVTVYVYVPGNTVNVPVPTYGKVPPVAEIVMVDMPPLHNIFDETPVQVNVVTGCVMFNVRITTQAFASLIFTV